MKLISILLFYVDHENESAYLLTSHMDLSCFNFFLRITVQEHILFHSRLTCARTRANVRQSVQLDQDLGYCHCSVNERGLGCAALTDPTYPQRVAFSLIQKVMTAFEDAFQESSWRGITADRKPPVSFGPGDALLKEYQNPTEADKLMRISKDLDETREIMILNIQQLLKRGEHLDDLMTKTDDLSKASEQFFRQAKSNNSCCGQWW